MGDASVAIPNLDGPLKPNNILEDADILAEKAGLNAIADDGKGGLYAGSSKDLLQIDIEGNAEVIEEFNSPIEALCQADGTLAIATGQHVVLRGGEYGGRLIKSGDGDPFQSLNALTFDGLGNLFISQGSMEHSSEEWKYDLMRHGASGRILKHVLETRETSVVASGLKYCYGVCPAQDGLLVSESWAHRLIEPSNVKIKSVLGDLPGYPAHITRASSGGYWLSLFSRRTQLVEFILREKEYREAMMQSVAPDYWVAPNLISGKDPLEPLQFGGVRTMGILKPWAPSRSYGLVIRLSEDLISQYSLHSRAGGNNHGTISAVESGDSLFVLAKGSGRILKLPLSYMT
jgi:hypothetical protein